MNEPISHHPYEPFIPENATKLIIGSIPPYRFCQNCEKLYNEDVRFYYGSKDNSFWKIISEITNIKLDFENTEKAITQRKDLLSFLKIGITDVIDACYHLNGKADDKSLKIIKQRDLRDLLMHHPQIDTLIYTSDFVKSQMNTIVDKNYHSLENKAERKWSTIINGKEYHVVVLYSPSPNALRGIPGGEKTRHNQYKNIFSIE